MNGKPGTWSAIETKLFLSFRTALIVGVSAALPYFLTAFTGYLQGQGGWLAMAGVAGASVARALYLRDADNTGRGA